MGPVVAVRQSVYNFMNEPVSSNAHDSIKICNRYLGCVLCGETRASSSDDVRVIRITVLYRPMDCTSGSLEQWLYSFPINFLTFLLSRNGIDIDLETQWWGSCQSDETRWKWR